MESAKSEKGQTRIGFAETEIELQIQEALASRKMHQAGVRLNEESHGKV